MATSLPRRARIGSIVPILALASLAGVLTLAPTSSAITSTPVMASTSLTASQLAGWFRSTGKVNHAAVSIDTLAALFVQEGADEHVAGDLAFAQAMVETGFLAFSARMPASHNNFSGLGAVDTGTGSASFPDARTGVRAQIQHLRAYADPTVTVARLHHPLVDGRFTLVSPKGKAPTWEQFGNGVWASSTTYAASVLRIHSLIRAWAAAHPSSPSTSSYAPYRTAAAVVGGGFDDLLGRAPSPTEAAAGSSLLTSGAVSAPTYYSALVAGEGRRVAHPVVRLYLAGLGRGPDRSGLRYWAGRVRAGESATRLAAILLGTDEFRRRFGLPTDGAYIDLLYRMVLGRGADAAGTAYWSARLGDDLDRGGLLVAFSDSPEFVRQVDWIADGVVTYLGMVEHLPQLIDLAWWRAQLDGGAPLSRLIERVWSSTEYRARVGA